MRIRKHFVNAVATVALTAFTLAVVAGPSWAQQKPSTSTSTASAKPAQPKAEAASVTQGTVKSVNGNMVVLSHLKNGKSEDLMLMTNTSTAKKGDLVVGAKATVHYRKENNQMIATSIEAAPVKTSAPKVTATPTKKPAK